MKIEIIKAVNENLQKASLLLESITEETYTDESIAPYHSSIGSHIRHILDFFNCIFEGIDANKIDLTSRKRDERISNNIEFALESISKVQQTMLTFSNINTDYLVHVTDNLGQGNVTVDYTLESILAHANSHAVHHYAVIGYMLSQLKVEHKVAGFGYNPTTPISQRKGI